MLVAGAAAATTARLLRDGIGRERPGQRDDGGFPSRHAAAATAISLAAGARQPVLGLGLGIVALVGSVGRIASAEHEPADIIAGAALGALVACLVITPLALARFALRGVGIR
jgi:undecaprenyl-diphosphatase